MKSHGSCQPLSVRRFEDPADNYSALPGLSQPRMQSQSPCCRLRLNRFKTSTTASSPLLSEYTTSKLLSRGMAENLVRIIVLLKKPSTPPTPAILSTTCLLGY